MLTTTSGPRGVSAWAKSPGQIAVTNLRIALISTTHMYWAPVVWLLTLGPGGVEMNEGGPRPSRRSLGAQLLPAACRASSPHLEHPPPTPHPPPWAVAWNRGIERRKNFDCIPLFVSMNKLPIQRFLNVIIYRKIIDLQYCVSAVP